MATKDSRKKNAKAQIRHQRKAQGEGRKKTSVTSSGA